MRLTKTTRNIFINSVMADVPKIDYDQQIEDAIRQEFIDALPPAVRRLWDDSQLRCYVKEGEVRNPHTYGYTIVPAYQKNMSYEASKKVLELCELRMQQKEKRQELSNMLHAVAWGHNTDKSLREALPELAHYVPRDGTTAADRTVPALTGVVDAFKKAGWPADKT